MRIDNELHERTGISEILSPRQLRRIKAARFRVESYEDLNYGDVVTHRANWSAIEDHIYVEEGIQDFVTSIRALEEYDTALTQLAKAELQGRDVGMLQLYLTSFAYFATIALLKDRATSHERMVEAFMRDVAEDRIQMISKVGLAGILLKDMRIELSNEVQLRRLNRSDYHDEFEPLVDKSIGQVSFPSQHTASAVLEFPMKIGPHLNTLYGSIGLFDVRLYSSVREFDLLIQQLIPLVQVWKGTLELVQSETDPMIRFIHVELNLPTISPDRPVFRWKRQYRTLEPRGYFSISKQDTGIITLSRALVARDYGRLVYAPDGDDTPRSLAYSRYIQILRSREQNEKMIRDEVEALEAFFTPEPDVTKTFIQRVAFLVRTLAVDENQTANLLHNAYSIRSSYTHRGKGWNESGETAPTTQEAGFAWENYKRDLSQILLVYLRLSIVSRILSQHNEEKFIEALDKSEKIGVPDAELASLRDQLSCKISRVNDFVTDWNAAERYQVPLNILRQRIERNQISAITMQQPGRRGQHRILRLIPEWALLSLREEMDHL